MQAEFTDAIRTFLEKPLLARMTTLDADGYPHSVPVWFVLHEDEFVIISFRKTLKVRQIAANPKGAIVIGGEPQDGAGYLFKGDFTMVDDTDRYWTRALTNRYESGAQAEKDIADWSQNDMITIRMKPTKIIKV